MHFHMNGFRQRLVFAPRQGANDSLLLETTHGHDDFTTLQTVHSKSHSSGKALEKNPLILNILLTPWERWILFPLKHSLKYSLFFSYDQITVVHTERLLQEKR